VCLYGGCENQLKVYGWEPAQCFDTLTTGWSRISDIAVAQKQLVCISGVLYTLYLNIHVLVLFVIFTVIHLANCGLNSIAVLPSIYVSVLHTGLCPNGLNIVEWFLPCTSVMF